MMGTTLDDPNDRLHQVTLSKPYCIDRTPVTVAEYRRCVEASACSEPHKPLDYNYGRAGRDNHPVNGVEWGQADAYCTWAKKRLPTDAEWELAARGTDGRKYPWGNEEPDDTRLWWSRSEEREGTSPVGSHPAGASPYGVLEMLGNVSQWVADYQAKFTADPQTDPTGPATGELRVLRGAAYDASLGGVHVGKRSFSNPSLQGGDTSCRCAVARSSP
ncbi:MAG: Serine/threonine kinase [Myxococcaceae bacterium]|nr:Serine/threonine kinase [Myxococcaceae bacterium]